MSENREVVQDINPVDILPETNALDEADNVLYGNCACFCLNVREAPNKTSQILTTIGEGKSVCIDLLLSTDDWYHVTLENGLAGYCMAEYITLAD